jgi:uncharacterized protein (TIRG00374 family)
MNKRVVLIIKLLLTSIILTYIFIKIPFSDILKTLFSGNLFLFILALLLTIPATLLSSFQTKYLTSIQKMSISFKEILKVYLTASFYSLFLPGTLLGGAVKWYKFKKHGSKSSAAVVVVFNRYLEVFIVTLIGLLFSIPALIGSKYTYLLPVWFIAFLLLFASYVFLLNASALNKIEKIFNKIPSPQAFKRKVRHLFAAMHEYQNLTLKDHFEILLIMFLYHFLSIISFYLLALSIDVSLSILVLGWIRSIVILSSILPISYSGLGVREGIIIYLFRFYGVPASEALVISLLSFARNLSIPLVGGIIELKDFLYGKNYKSIEKHASKTMK